jgi:hypothetical protein
MLPRRRCHRVQVVSNIFGSNAFKKFSPAAGPGGGGSYDKGFNVHVWGAVTVGLSELLDRGKKRELIQNADGVRGAYEALFSRQEWLERLGKKMTKSNVLALVDLFRTAAEGALKTRFAAPGRRLPG